MSAPAHHVLHLERTNLLTLIIHNEIIAEIPMSNNNSLVNYSCCFAKIQEKNVCHFGARFAYIELFSNLYIVVWTFKIHHKKYATV